LDIVLKSYLTIGIRVAHSKFRIPLSMGSLRDWRLKNNFPHLEETNKKGVFL